MHVEQFWTSQDGQVLLVKNKDERSVSLTLAFWPRNPAEFEFMKARISDLKFTERSSLARIGIEMQIHRGLETEGNRLILGVEAFAFDLSFPNSGYWKKLLRPGVPIGRLFHAPAGAKLSSDEIWTAIRDNRLKLPNTISIDSQGSVFLTPHQVSYTLNPRLQRINFELVVSGTAGRSFLDKVQIRHDASPLAIQPRSGILTSCSMYLKEHFVVLNQGAGNFGIHTRAILLDPVNTCGKNVMLEIYNQGDHPVVEPGGFGRDFPRPGGDRPGVQHLRPAAGNACSGPPPNSSPNWTTGRRRTQARPTRKPGSRSAARAPRWKTARSASREARPRT